MEKIYYNKLCRDKVPEIIRSKGFECDVREMDDGEYRLEILRKVHEEASGVANNASRDMLLKELADLTVTIDAVKKEYGITDADVNEAVAASIDEKGGFEDRLYLSWSSDTEYNSRDQGQEIN